MKAWRILLEPVKQLVWPGNLVKGVRFEAGRRNGPQALLSYIIRPFCVPPLSADKVRFSNIGIGRSWVKVLLSLGYDVDVVNWDDRRVTVSRHYDLFVGHGGINFQTIAEQLSPETLVVFFSAGTYWAFHAAQEQMRVNYLFERRGVMLSPDRPTPGNEEWANRRADAIICLGNEFVRDTYSKFQNVFSLNNASYPDNAFEQIRKDYEEARRNFLFFAGGGNLHKGLDLLLDAFVQETGLHLHVCQAIQPEFYAVYQHELEERPNIHTHGFITLRSSQFYDLVRRCAFVILPSASEGCNGAVVECMNQGLIPVVSRESTVETGEYGVTLGDCRVETIRSVVRDLSGQPVTWCKEMSLRTRQAALTEFAGATFRCNLSLILRHILRDYKGWVAPIASQRGLHL